MRTTALILALLVLASGLVGCATDGERLTPEQLDRVQDDYIDTVLSD